MKSHHSTDRWFLYQFNIFQTMYPDYQLQELYQDWTAFFFHFQSWNSKNQIISKNSTLFKYIENISWWKVVDLGLQKCTSYFYRYAFCAPNIMHFVLQMYIIIMECAHIQIDTDYFKTYLILPSFCCKWSISDNFQGKI